DIIENLPSGTLRFDRQSNRTLIAGSLSLNVEIKGAARGQRIPQAIVFIVLQDKRELRPARRFHGIRVIAPAATGQLIHGKPISSVRRRSEVQRGLIAVGYWAFAQLLARRISARSERIAAEP